MGVFKTRKIISLAVTVSLVAFGFASAVVMASDWPQVGQNAQHTGYTDLKGSSKLYSIKWSKSLGVNRDASPVSVDVNGDGKDEILILGNRIVYDENGGVVWGDEAIYCKPGEVCEGKWCPGFSECNAGCCPPPWACGANSSCRGEDEGAPGVGDVDGDGNLDIVYWCGDSDHLACRDAADGNYRWLYSGSPTEPDSDLFDELEAFAKGVTPVLGDLNNDGKDEVVISGRDFLYVLNGETGAVKWKADLPGGTLSTPSIGDIDGDGRNEVVLEHRWNLDGVGGFDNAIKAWDSNGIELWSRSLFPDKCGTYFGYTVLADVVPANPGLEVIVEVVGTLYVLNGFNGNILWQVTVEDDIGFPYPTFSASPAVADIDNDGKLEIVVPSELNGGEDIMVLNGEDGSLVWKRNLSGEFYGSPAIADLDSDGQLEIIAAATGKLYILDRNGNNKQVFNISTFSSHPAIADVDGDGEAEILILDSSKVLHLLDKDTDPPILATEAWIPAKPAGTFINNGDIINLEDIDEAGEFVTIYSTASDNSGVVANQKIRYWINGALNTTEWNWPAAGGLHSITISGPLSDGDFIEYQSEATDNATNTGYNPIDGVTKKSFTVKSVSVTLSAAPPSGDAPLTSVLTAAVGGSAVGPTTYRFDCGKGGGWGPVIAANNTTCNYPAAAAVPYTARVEVTRQGITATGTVDIVVNPPNNKPVMTSVTITPDPAYTNTILTANHIPDIGDVDADGDPITYSYQWKKGGVDIGGETNKTLLSGNFVKNDAIEVTVTPNDGIDDGLPMTSAPPLIISNTLPAQPTVSITPGAPIEIDNLICNIDVVSTDIDVGDVVKYTYKWYKFDGAAFVLQKTTANTINLSDTLNSALTSTGEIWKCRVIPNDGDDDGPFHEDSVAISATLVAPIASIVCNSTSFPGSCQAYAFNGTNDDYCLLECTIELENASTDKPDCPAAPCVIPPDKGFKSCVWNNVDGNTADSCNNTTIFLGEGNYIDGAELTVTDQDDLSDSDQKTLIFKKDVHADFECSLDAGATWEKCDALISDPEVDDTIDFRAVDGTNLSTESDGSGGLDTFDWDFDDGVGAGATTSHIYTVEKDPYTVSLIVTDLAGRRAKRSYNITVGAATVNFPRSWMEISPR